MRFPIIRKNVSWVEFENLSGAMIESLSEMQIIDPRTRKPRQDYFDLPIEEGPLLGLMLELFDLMPECHAGCTTDLRPPSFVFYAKKGDGGTSEGEYVLRYIRELKLSVFLQNASFRSKGGARDLLELSKAYNDRQNCSETVGVYSHTRDGNVWILVHFDGNVLKEIEGHWNFDKEHQWFQSPVYGRQTPLRYVGAETKIAEISQAYRVREEELRDATPHFYGHKLSKLGYNVTDAVLGMMKLGGRIFGLKIPLTGGRIAKACENYALPSSDFDYLAEWRMTKGLWDDVGRLA